MFASYHRLPVPVTYHRPAPTPGMSPINRVFFVLIFSITVSVVVFHATTAYDSFHKSALETIGRYSNAAAFTDLGIGHTSGASWKSIIRLGATKPRIGTCTVAHGEHKEGYQRALSTHISHGDYHKYPTYLLDHPILDGLWSKESLLLELLLQELSKPKPEQLEWLVWFDADTVIMNKLIPLETFLPPEERSDVHLLYTKDWNGLNNGVFMLRVSTWSLELLSSVLAYRTFRPEDDLPFTEQSAMEKVMQMDKYKVGAVQCPPQWFNSYPGDGDEGDVHFDHRPGQLLVHFAGVGDKSKAISEWIDRLEANRTRWEMPLSETNYERQIEEFWRGLEEERLQHKDEKTAAEDESTREEGTMREVGEEEEDKEDKEQDRADEAKAKEIIEKTTTQTDDNDQKSPEGSLDSLRELWDGLVL